MIHRASPAVVLLAAIAFAAGCASNAGSTGSVAAPADAASGDKPYANLLIGPETARELGYSIRWQTPLQLPAHVNIQHAKLFGNRLVVMDDDNVAYVLDTETGGVRWSSKIGTALERFTTPTVDEEQLVMCSETRCYVYDINHGDELRTIDLYYGSNTSPAIIQGLMIHGNGSGMVWGQDLQTGIRKWVYKFPRAVAVDPIATFNGVIVTTHGGHVALFNPREGTVLWQQQAFDRISTTPTAGEQFVFVASEDQSAYAFFLNSGEMRWRYFSRDPLYTSPVAVGSRVLVNESSRGIVAIDALGGDVKWTNPLKDARFIQASGDVLHFHADSKVHVVEAKSGKTWSAIDLPGIDRIVATDPKGGDLMLIQSGSGKIMKLQQR